MKKSGLFYTLVVAVSTSNCGGAGLTGSTEAKKTDRKESSTSGGEEANASDPAVVTGAYLACETIAPANAPINSSSSSSSKMSMSGGKSTPITFNQSVAPTSNSSQVGCNIMANSKKLDADKDTKYVFSATTNGSTQQPLSNNSNPNYHAVFATNPSDRIITTYNAEIFTNGGTSKSAFCSGSSLPCKAELSVAKLTLATIGVWQPSDAGNAQETIASANCPLNPDIFCESNSQIAAVKPFDEMSPGDKNLCFNFLNSLLGGLSGPIASKYKTSVQSSQSVTLDKKSQCVIRKKSSAGGVAALLNQGANKGCYTVFVRDGGVYKNFILSAQSVSNTKDLVKELEGFACQ